MNYCSSPSWEANPRNYLHFMRPEHLLQWSKQPIIHSYPHPDKNSPHPPILVPLILSSHPCIGLASSHFPSNISTKTLTYIHIISSSWSKHSNNTLSTMPFCNHTHTIFSTQYKSWSPSFLSFLQPHVTSTLFKPNIFLSVPFLVNLRLRFFSMCGTKFPTHKSLDSKQKDKKVL
jgi:hypothetical protein